MRQTLIAGNWKMHGSKAQTAAFFTAIKQQAHYSQTEILVCPTFLHLAQAHEILASSSPVQMPNTASSSSHKQNHDASASKIKLGAQNLYLGAQGAFTGEVSGNMLADLGCEYVIIGHSERRALFHEDLSLVAKKFQAALAATLKPILCIGETRAERESGQTENIIRQQLTSVAESLGTENFQQAFTQGAVIAYEPVWAIGTGLTATPEQAQQVHAYIRTVLTQNKVDLVDTIRILYGGSMKPDNAAALLAMPDIDGGLIGGASLEVSSFLAICEAAEELVA